MNRYFLRSTCVAFTLASGGAHGQAFPAKPIEFVVPGNPGAGADVFARLIAELIRKEKLIAQPIVITNKAGGGGAIGAVLENVFENVYRSAGWQDYMTRNLMEPVYMNGAEYGRYLAARQPEFARFISDMGLASKK